MKITFTQLAAFEAVVRLGSVTRAAKELGVTQPSVSAAIGALERELEADVLERDGRGVCITAAGSAFLPYAIGLIALLERGTLAVQEAGRWRVREAPLVSVVS